MFRAFFPHTFSHPSCTWKWLTKTERISIVRLYRLSSGCFFLSLSVYHTYCVRRQFICIADIYIHLKWNVADPQHCCIIVIIIHAFWVVCRMKQSSIAMPVPMEWYINININVFAVISFCWSVSWHSRAHQFNFHTHTLYQRRKTINAH